MASVQKSRLTLSQIFEDVLENLPEDNKRGVITDHAFLRCFRTGGLRGFSAGKQSQLFQVIDKEEKGFISCEEMLTFLVENRSKEDRLDVGVRLLLQAALERSGNPIEEVSLALSQYEDSALIGLEQLMLVLGIRAVGSFYEALELLVIWLMEQEFRKAKAKDSLPEKVGCTPAFLLKKLKKRQEDKEYAEGDSEEIRTVSSRVRLTTHLQLMDAENDLFRSAAKP